MITDIKIVPDYTKAIANVGNNYTAPEDGIYWFSIVHCNSPRNIYINDKEFYWVLNSYGTPGGTQIILGKGDRIYISSKTTGGFYSSYFIPFK